MSWWWWWSGFALRAQSVVVCARQVVKDFMERVWERGDIYLDSYSGYYCVGCEEFKDEKELEQGQVCPTHRKECQLRSEQNYFFRLSAYQKVGTIASLDRPIGREREKKKGENVV